MKKKQKKIKKKNKFKKKRPIIKKFKKAKKINIRVLDKENSFNDFADQHPMN